MLCCSPNEIIESKSQSTKEVVNELHKVKIVHRDPMSVLACYRTTEFYKTAIGNGEKLEKQIKIQQETVQLVAEWGKVARTSKGILVVISASA